MNLVIDLTEYLLHLEDTLCCDECTFNWYFLHDFYIIYILPQLYTLNDQNALTQIGRDVTKDQFGRSQNL